jgi:competence protein ComEC
MSFRSTLLFFLTAACLLGQVCAAQTWFPASTVWLGVSSTVLCLLFFLLSRQLAIQLLILAACFFATFFVSSAALQQVLNPALPADHLRQLALPREVRLEGWLFREPERFPQRGRLYVEALQVWRDGVAHPAQGKVLISVRSLTGPWQYGDVLGMTVRLRAPRNFHTPGSFDYEGYLARQRIYATAFLWDDGAIERLGWQGQWLRGRIEHLRRTIGTFFSTHLDEQTAAVLRALIIGDEGQLTKDVRAAFSRAGVAHVLSISGLHLGLVAAASYGAWWWLLGRSRYLLLRFVMPKLAAVLTIPPVLLYAGLAGGSVATWRSVVMVLVYLCAILLDRRDEVYRSLALAALLISLLWPGAVLDISFQLSFLSVLSIVLGMKRFSKWWEEGKTQRLSPLPPWRERLYYWSASYLVVSFCALLGSAPLTAFHFNQVSIAGLLANLLIVPLLGSGAVILGLSAAALLFFLPSLAALVLACAGLITQAGVWLTHLIGSWSLASFSVVTPTILELFLLYGCLASGVFLRAWSSRLPSAVPYYCLLTFTSALFVDGLFWVHSRYFCQDLRVTFLDVGQGDAAVVELPGSQVMVIDGGGFASEEFDAGAAIVAPFLWSRKIGRVDIVVMSHPQLDHYGGLTFVVEHFAPREFWFNGEHASIERFVRLRSTLERKGVLFRTLCRDMAPMPVAGVSVRIMHPPCQQTGLDTNNASLVLRLSHGTIDLLFTGDLEAGGEQVLLSHGGEVASEIVKAPHHGSRTSSTAAFIDAVEPHLVVASLGYFNRFGFPAEEVVRRYERRQARFLRTDQDGAVTVVSNGRTYRVAVAHERPGAR